MPQAACHTRRPRDDRTGTLIVACLAVSLLTGCGGQGASIAASPRDNPAVGLASPAARMLAETGVEPFAIEDFDAVHEPLDATGNAALIFGALPIASGTGLPRELAVFLGRWEGYGYGPPIKRDWKYVLAVTEISPGGGTAYLWAGTNLEFPAAVQRVRFRVHGTGPETAMEWEQEVDGAYAIVRIRHAGTTDALEGIGEAADPAAHIGRVLLRRDVADHVVHRDYEVFLAERGIRWTPHGDPALAASGSGSLVYLPRGYDQDPDRRWPLVLFLHGSGDRGENGLVIAQNSPFRYVTAGGSLEAVVVAPLLGQGQPAFPTAYLEGVLDDALARYRVDERNVAVTGLSMGGEAAYRLARTRPADVGRLAVLCGFDTAHFPAARSWGYPPIDEPEAGLRDVPVLVVHGRDDTVVPLEAAHQTVAALEAAGVDVRFDILDHHDHDVWSDTYADSGFYRWLLPPDATAKP